jgi:hypothetical protein
MLKTRGLRIFLPLLLSVAACSDMTAPVARTSASAASMADESVVVRLEGSYESRDRVAVADGTLYLVQVHFGAGARADGHTYLAQVGVERGSSAATTLLQQQYEATGSTVTFAGTLLSPGVLSGDELTLKVSVDGDWIPVHLTRTSTPALMAAAE